MIHELDLSLPRDEQSKFKKGTLYDYGAFIFLLQNLVREPFINLRSLFLVEERRGDLGVSRHLKAIGGRYMDIAALLGHMRRMDAKVKSVAWMSSSCSDLVAGSGV